MPAETATDLSALIPALAAELKLRPAQVEAAARLLDEGATVPFIARYRKEATGALDEVAIAAIADGLARLRELEKRRAAIRASLEERALLTPALAGALAAARTLAALEDLYLPYRPKRRTRAQQARERGLAPLAEALLAGGRFPDPAPFVGGEVADAEAALAGARDIIAETASEDAATRAELRQLVQRQARLVSAVARGKRENEEAAKFRDWFEWSEELARGPAHRLRATLRGREAGFLTLSAQPPAESALALLRQRWLRPDRHQGRGREQLDLALADGWERLLAPSLETEALGQAKERADAEAIKVFAENLRGLLLAAPFGRRAVLAVDPGLRTGGKTVALDDQGALLATATIFPHEPRRQAEAAATIRAPAAHRPAAVAVGNGTAGRETADFLEGLALGIPVVLVSESGASIYSAGEVARREFPELDLTVRGAISIGRRLQDPLAELVKLDPKSIGVGQYQHDVDQAALRAGLERVVESCVNAVGVELSTASEELLAYVSGLGPALAKAIVAYRREHGGFRDRRELREVPRLGAKAFEQCAGFLRLRESREPLDASAVHPERYPLVKRMAADLAVEVGELLRRPELLRGAELKRWCGDGVGEPTLRDIVAELAKPGRDPRPEFALFRFADVHKPEDLAPGMVLPGIVTNVTRFGAFVDLGIKQDGLVHISELSERFVNDPAEVVAVRQQVRVRVLLVDLPRRRIALSMKGLQGKV
ncbi:MAG: helix-hairpin-helix domain-containing protein [Planctomycetes bacterium]|nr:helix-hairpin-helix domain-containing protein [Planctomycetota bacterium]